MELRRAIDAAHRLPPTGFNLVGLLKVSNQIQGKFKGITKIYVSPSRVKAQRLPGTGLRLTSRQLPASGRRESLWEKSSKKFEKSVQKVVQKRVPENRGQRAKT